VKNAVAYKEKNNRFHKTHSKNQRRRVLVVAEAIRLKANYFLAYRGRHPQSAEASRLGNPKSSL